MLNTIRFFTLKLNTTTYVNGFYYNVASMVGILNFLSVALLPLDGFHCHRWRIPYICLRHSHCPHLPLSLKLCVSVTLPLFIILRFSALSLIAITVVIHLYFSHWGCLISKRLVLDYIFNILVPTISVYDI